MAVRTPFKTTQMSKKENAQFAEKNLAKLYPDIGVHLDYENAYTLLIAVLLSAQCTDKRVNMVTPKLFALASTPQKMLKLGQKKIAEIIHSCGFFNAKSANIVKLSQTLVDEYNGEVPQNMRALESLAGVGHKTASVVMMQAFGVPTFPVDTHIHRLAKRWKLSSGKDVETTEKDLKKLFPQETWNKLHLRLIQYGRDYCKAHTCKTKETLCPLCKKFNAL